MESSAEGEMVADSEKSADVELQARLRAFAEWREAHEKHPNKGRPCPSKGMLLCLSGGGFRAAAFHLGAIRRLVELRLFDKITQVRAVSGGAILAGHIASVEATMSKRIRELAFEEFEEEIAAPFRVFLRQDLRTLPLILSSPVNWWWKHPRLWLVEHRLKDRLATLQNMQLSNISPLWHFIASDLITAEEAEFSSDWRFVSEFQLWREQFLTATQPWATYEATDVREWPLARVMLASAAFPPVFGPLRLPVHVLGAPFSVSEDMALSDGGVVRNLGLPSYPELFSRVLISDASYPRDLPSYSHLPRRWWSVALHAAMRQGDDRWLQRGSTNGFEVTKWVIAAQSEGELETSLSRVRTDLDRFTEGEINLLENRGYSQADKWLTSPELEIVDPVGAMEANPPHPEWLDESVGASALCGSSHRFLKLRRLRRLRRTWSGRLYLVIGVLTAVSIIVTAAILIAKARR
jgi:NTE family protein